MIFCFLILCFVYSFNGLECFVGTFPTGAITIQTGCEVCQVVGTLNFTFTASCETAANCAAAQAKVYPNGNLGSVKCCGTSQCNAFNPCVSQTSCYGCLYDTNERCGWCSDKKKCIDLSTAPSDCNPVYIDALTSNATKNNPLRYTNYLTPGITSTVNVNTNGGAVTGSYPRKDVDIFLLVNGAQTIQSVAQGINNALPQFSTLLSTWKGGNVRFGLGSFTDKPIAPLGSSPFNFEFQVVQQMMDNVTDFANVFSNFIQNGLVERTQDREAALSGLFYAASRDQAIKDGKFYGSYQPTPIEIGFNNAANKVILVLTDSPSRQSGEGATAGITKGNDGSPNMGGEPVGSGEDYPTISQIRDVLIANNIIPIFATSDCSSISSCNSTQRGSQPPTFVSSAFSTVVTNLGFGERIDVSDAVATDVSNSLFASVQDAYKKVLVSVVQDPYKRVASVSNYGIVAVNGPEITSANGIQFSVDLFAPQYATSYPSSKIVLRIPGVTTVEIFTYFVQATCESGKCMEKSCVGCDGVYYADKAARAVVDGCGVCGGRNASCTGCDGVFYKNSRLVPVFDHCNVCGGDNFTCSGCDGNPNSGAEISDCGVCNASSINGCSGWHPVGIAGVVIFISAFLLIFLIIIILVLIYLKLSALEAKLQKNPLCKEAKQRCINT